MPAGRPTKYTKALLKSVKLLSELGATTEQIAEFIDVNPDTIYEWTKVYPEFSETIKGGKSKYDDEIEESLAKRAKGYHRTIERVSKDGGVIPCLEEVPPDVTAIKFWLTNRRAGRWKEKQEVQHSGEITVNLNLFTKTK